MAFQHLQNPGQSQYKIAQEVGRKQENGGFFRIHGRFFESSALIYYWRDALLSAHNSEIAAIVCGNSQNTQTGFETMALAVKGSLRRSELQFATKLTHFHGIRPRYPTKCHKVAETKTI